jgi:hypothetical protein
VWAGLHTGSLHGRIPAVPPPVSVTQVFAGTVANTNHPSVSCRARSATSAVGGVMVLLP